MVLFGLLLLETLTALQNVIRISQQYALMLDNSTSVVVSAADFPRIEPIYETSHHHTSIHHYGRHGLCRNFEGQKNLYKAFKTKFCNTRLSFTADLVIELCIRKDEMLDRWVSELFDLDGDGFITHHEKQYYSYVR